MARRGRVGGVDLVYPVRRRDDAEVALMKNDTSPLIAAADAMRNLLQQSAGGLAFARLAHAAMTPHD